MSLPQLSTTTKPEPTRIAFCITELDPGGAERMLTQLVLGLDRTVWEPRVYCLGPPAHFGNVLEAAGITVRYGHARGWWSAPRVLWWLTRELRRFRPALIQSFLFHANQLGTLAAIAAGVPVRFRGIRVADRRHHKYVARERWLDRWVTQNVCVSRGVADYFTEITGLPENRCVVIPNSVDVARFTTAQPLSLAALGVPVDATAPPIESAEETATAQPTLWLSIGRLETQKDYPTLLAAWETMAREFPHAHLAIAGVGPDRKALEADAERRHIAHLVHFLGFRDDIPNLLATCSGFVLASRWEGMPNAVLEAMAAARPVVTTNVEGIAELVQEGVTGQVVPPGDAPALATAIRRHLAQPVWSQGLGQAAQQHVLKHFTTQSMIARYVELYERALDLVPKIAK